MPDCIHHFRIALPNGPTSAGRCLKCGLVRQFANYSVDMQYGRDYDKPLSPSIESVEGMMIWR